MCVISELQCVEFYILCQLVKNWSRSVVFVPLGGAHASESESLLLPSFHIQGIFSGVFGVNLNIENIGKIEKTYLQ